MSNLFQDLKASRKGKRSLRDAASPLYRWLRENREDIADLRNTGIATWKEILDLARQAGIEVAVTDQTVNAMRKKWQRITNEELGLPVDTKAPQRQARTSTDLPPSKTDPNWRPPEIERIFSEDTADRSAETALPVAVKEESPVAPTTDRKPPFTGSPVRPEDNERIPQHSRDSLARMRAKIRARKEERFVTSG